MDMIKQLDKFFANGFYVSITTIVSSLLILFFLNYLLNQVIRKHFKKKEMLIMKVKKIILIILSLCLVLSEIVPLQSFIKTIIASGGILAVVVGLASQEAASSMINGFMIVAYKPYAIGDVIFVPSENIRGTVIDITSRHTVIRTYEKTQVTIPNVIMNKVVIENISNTPNQKANYLYLDVSYDCDLNEAIALIQQEAEKHPLFKDIRTSEQIQNHEPAVPVYCLAFKDSSIQLRATIHSQNSSDGFAMLSDLRIAIKTSFDEHGIEIPFQQVVVHQNDAQS